MMEFSLFFEWTKIYLFKSYKFTEMLFCLYRLVEVEFFQAARMVKLKSGMCCLSVSRKTTFIQRMDLRTFFEKDHFQAVNCLRWILQLKKLLPKRKISACIICCSHFPSWTSSLLLWRDHWYCFSLVSIFEWAFHCLLSAGLCAPSKPGSLSERL